MIVIVGESASGKSTLLDMFVESNPDYKKVVTYTTRPMRDGEVNGINYNFVTEEAFDALSCRDFFIEENTYRDWHYGTAKCDCSNADNKIVVLTPAGLRALRRENIQTTSIYLYVDRKSRLIQSLQRGDDIEEAYRRNLTDVGQFDSIIDDVDYVIDNTQFHMSPKQVLYALEHIVKNAELEKE